MSRQLFTQTLITAESDGAALANSTTATSILPTHAIYTLPANDMDIGKQYEVEAWGRISTTGTPTLVLALYLAGASFIASQAITTGSGMTNVTWMLKLLLTCRAIGNGTTANCMFTGMALGIGGAGVMTQIPASAPAVSSGFNSVASNAVDLYATWGTASASNTITLHQYSLRSLN